MPTDHIKTSEKEKERIQTEHIERIAVPLLAAMLSNTRMYGPGANPIGEIVDHSIFTARLLIQKIHG